MLNGSMILKNVTQEIVSSLFNVLHARDLRTSFRHLYPHIVLIEAVPIGVKPRQLPTIILHVPSPIHRRILLVPEHNAITGLALA
jgi:hypothetical protein